jgi:hypothetical protein
MTWAKRDFKIFLGGMLGLGAVALLLSPFCLASDQDIATAVSKSRQRLGEAYEIGKNFKQPSPELYSQLVDATERVTGATLTNAMAKNAIETLNRLRDQNKSEVESRPLLKELARERADISGKSGGKLSSGTKGGDLAGADGVAETPPHKSSTPKSVLKLDGSAIPREVEFGNPSSSQPTE